MTQHDPNPSLELTLLFLLLKLCSCPKLTQSELLVNITHAEELNLCTPFCNRCATLTCAVSTTAVQFVTVIAHTAEHPWKVLARSEHTDVLEITLIDVCESERGMVSSAT